ncbi:MAG: hypothetical protein AB7S92_25570 [Parvibaculaceae bacterium]
MPLIIVATPLSAEARDLPVDNRISGRASKLEFSRRACMQPGNLPCGFFEPDAHRLETARQIGDGQNPCRHHHRGLSAAIPATAFTGQARQRGPMLKQRRCGFSNELVEVWKFRSMYTALGGADDARARATRAWPCRAHHPQNHH